jgi:hypothetical protein
MNSNDAFMVAKSNLEVCILFTFFAPTQSHDIQFIIPCLYNKMISMSIRARKRESFMVRNGKGKQINRSCRAKKSATVSVLSRI